ncbi:hypothetical protein O3P69_020962 [Scylla paramamosain]|uniref:Uncharacterized protein n=1 Tax=Scylla paramamosain TaxID=85552 RepID=A0AAW0SGL9_SCYPA
MINQEEIRNAFSDDDYEFFSTFFNEGEHSPTQEKKDTARNISRSLPPQISPVPALPLSPVYAATRSTGIVYDENDQKPITKLSDHSGLTIGEVFSSAIGNKRCSCMRSESFKNSERKDAEELANLANDAEYNTTPYNGYNIVRFNKIEYSRVDEDDEDGSVFCIDSEEVEEDD